MYVVWNKYSAEKTICPSQHFVVNNHSSWIAKVDKLCTSVAGAAKVEPEVRARGAGPIATEYMYLSKNLYFLLNIYCSLPQWWVQGIKRM
jgi:hypothetical protein